MDAHEIGHGEKLTRKQDAAIAALLSEPTQGQVCARVGISKPTLLRWMRTPTFASAYETARKELVADSVRRLTAANGKAIETLVELTEGGEKDADRIRAAIAILSHTLGKTIKLEGETTHQHKWTITIEELSKMPLAERIDIVRGRQKAG